MREALGAARAGYLVVLYGPTWQPTGAGAAQYALKVAVTVVPVSGAAAPWRVVGLGSSEPQSASFFEVPTVAVAFRTETRLCRTVGQRLKERFAGSG